MLGKGAARASSSSVAMLHPCQSTDGGKLQAHARAHRGPSKIYLLLMVGAVVVVVEKPGGSNSLSTALATNTPNCHQSHVSQKGLFTQGELNIIDEVL